jgi:voltage-gated potassium channel
MKKKDLKSNYLTKERQKFLLWLEFRLEFFLVCVSIAWLLLLILFVFFQATYILFFFFLTWIIIIADFLLKFLVAPLKFFFLKKNLILLISLALPPIRIINYERHKHKRWIHFFLIRPRSKNRIRKYNKK